ncbi:CynX/NimT family MFS transporter [Microbacterium sp. 2216-1]|uniref:MFS transporter n=1 Tax=Microbacterium sp. 2216-1 TaxID=3390053 RepID=UPI00397541A7
MTRASARPLWRGRALAMLGIVLCAFSLRSAVASLSPVIELIGADFTVSPTVLGIIGTIPPVCFALFGLITPMLEQRLGIERVAVIALLTITAGIVSRGLVGDSVGLLAATALTFAGVGMGNILLPPLVKKYFPDRIGLMMTLYTTAMSFSTFLPPMVAVPVAEATDWRFSLAMWGAFALAGAIPWMLMLLRPADDSIRHSAPQEAPRTAPVTRPSSGGDEPALTGPIATAPATRRIFGRLRRIPLVWALAFTFGTSSTMAYVTFAWMPVILVDLAGVSAATAGFLLSLFATVSLPASLLVPVLVVRFQATRPLFAFGSIGGLIGLIGLLLAPLPGLLPLWMVLFGLVGVLFPLSLVLISIRSRTPESAVVLSSFVQSVGYTFAAVFPLLIGVLHDLTHAWTVPLLIVAGVLVVTFPAGMIAGRRVTVEDEWERRHGKW